jgi:hypothetical protein
MDGMNLAMGKALRANRIGSAFEYARAFYLLLGNRRKYDRQPISGAVRLTISGYAVATIHTCACIDISPRGMGVDCPESIAAETIVELHADELGAGRPARVCYCHEQGTGYRIGLEFAAGDRKGYH